MCNFCPNLTAMGVRQFRVLALEFFRSVNKLNPVYMQGALKNNVNSKRYKDPLKVLIRNSVTFGDKNRRCFVKKVFLKISQNSQEKTCATISFFPVNFAIFKNTFFVEHLWWLLLRVIGTHI